jgi:hypothetical protein
MSVENAEAVAIVLGVVWSSMLLWAAFRYIDRD